MAFLVVLVFNGIRGICRPAQGCFEAMSLTGGGPGVLARQERVPGWMVRVLGPVW